jgi:hypothetical protein
VKKLKPNKDALTTRITSGGLFVCKLHYAADQYKNPANERGKEWLKVALNGYPGGMQDPNWLKEMEIKYTAGSGQRLFPNWHKWQKSSNILVDGDIDISTAKVYGSYDHGYANPAAYLVHCIFPEGDRITLWEFYASEVPVPMIARIIKGESVTLDDGRSFDGNPYAGKEITRICDPEIERATQVMAKGPNKSISDLFKKDKVFFTPGERGDDMTVVNWLSGNLWLNIMNPGYQIHRRCENLIWEISKLQRKAWTPLQMRTRNMPEELIDKDNHAWDALKYWLKKFPVGVAAKAKPEQHADFNFWRDMGKSKVKRSYVRDFAK